MTKAYKNIVKNQSFLRDLLHLKYTKDDLKAQSITFVFEKEEPEKGRNVFEVMQWKTVKFSRLKNFAIQVRASYFGGGFILLGGHVDQFRLKNT